MWGLSASGGQPGPAAGLPCCMAARGPTRALRAAPRAALWEIQILRPPADPLRLGRRSPCLNKAADECDVRAPEWKALNRALGAQAHVPHRPPFGFWLVTRVPLDT